MQYGIYFDQTRCMGCFTCVVACRDWHDVPAGPASYIRLTTVEKGRCPELSPLRVLHSLRDGQRVAQL